MVVTADTSTDVFLPSERPASEELKHLRVGFPGVAIISRVPM